MKAGNSVVGGITYQRGIGQDRPDTITDVSVTILNEV